MRNTSPSSPIATISKGDLKRVFTGKKSNLDGVKAVPFMLAESNPAAVSFLKDVLGMSPEEYKKFWDEYEELVKRLLPLTKE